jgi:hypothetical protein
MGFISHRTATITYFLKMSFVPIQQTFMMPVILEVVMIILATKPMDGTMIERLGVLILAQSESQIFTSLMEENPRALSTTTIPLPE